jgi:hypothetical protein
MFCPPDNAVTKNDIIAAQIVKFPLGGQATFSYTYYYQAEETSGRAGLWVDSLETGAIGSVCYKCYIL